MVAFKKLPLGLQDFPKIIANDYLYIDKMAYIHTDGDDR